MKMKTDNVPALVMLIAGVVYCLIGICCGIELTCFLSQLLIVLIVFLIIGNILKAVFDKTMSIEEPETIEENTELSMEESEELIEDIENIEA